jgi:hypothetical protein
VRWDGFIDAIDLDLVNKSADMYEGIVHRRLPAKGRDGREIGGY